jgi:hypothetical protein
VPRLLRLRWPSTCTACRSDLPAGTPASWDTDAKTATCLSCLDPEESRSTEPAVDGGTAGASARREHERRAARERQRKEKAVEDDAAWRKDIVERRPIVGRFASAITAKPTNTPDSHNTTAWKTGAVGEERVAEILATCNGVVSLHDRRIPGSKANIDHVVIAPAGVFVIDAKKYVGKRVERRDVGPLWRADVRLYVGGRDSSRLVEGVLRQVDVVSSVLTGAGESCPVRGVLCFVESDWSLRMRPISIDGVVAVWPKGLPTVLASTDACLSCDVAAVARILASALRAA